MKSTLIIAHCKIVDGKGNTVYEKNNIPLLDNLRSLNGLNHTLSGNGFPKFIVYLNVIFDKTYYVMVRDSFELKQKQKEISNMPHKKNVRIMNKPPLHAIKR